MSTSDNPYIPESGQAVATATNASAASVRTYGLRWWPAAALLALMPAVKFMPDLFESAPLPVLMIGFMGPGAIAVLLVGWWLFASRAPWRERLLSVAVLVAIGVVAAVLLHPSMQGMTQMFFQLPAGLAAFTLAMIVLKDQPQQRMKSSLLCAAAGFFVWNLLKLDGVTGKFSSEMSWRWSPTAEDNYMEQLADSSAAAKEPDAAGDTETITRANAEWPEFRGPNRDSHYPGITLATDWTSTPPVVKWKTLVGPGWSSFTVAGRRLFTQEQRGDNEAVVCLDAETGTVLWAHEYKSRFWEAIAGAGPRATPTIGDHGLYSLGANGELLCLDPATGRVVWQRLLQDESQRKPPQWGFSSSPLIVGDLVVVHAGGPADKGVLAFDAKSGEPRWSVASGDHSYSSPHSATFDGVTGILMATNRGLQFLDATTGAQLWEHAWETPNYRAIQPLIVGNAVYIGTSLGGGTRRVEVAHEGDNWTITEAWTSLDMKPDFNDYVAYDNRIYGFDGNIFACIDMQDGRRLWKRGRYGNGQVLLLSQSGQMLVISEHGDLILLQADPTALKELAMFPALDGKTWNHPVLVGNELYLRNGKEAVCLKLPVMESASHPETVPGA